jgi:hypothetical protein
MEDNDNLDTIRCDFCDESTSDEELLRNLFMAESIKGRYLYIHVCDTCASRLSTISTDSDHQFTLQELTSLVK